MLGREDLAGSGVRQGGSCREHPCRWSTPAPLRFHGSKALGADHEERLARIQAARRFGQRGAVAVGVHAGVGAEPDARLQPPTARRRLALAGAQAWMPSDECVLPYRAPVVTRLLLKFQVVLIRKTPPPSLRTDMPCNHCLGDLGIAQPEGYRLQQRALKFRAGDEANRMAAQLSLPHRARRDGAATLGCQARALDAGGLRA